MPRDAELVTLVEHPMFPLLATADGHVVLYRMRGDAWQVAPDERDIRFLTSLTERQRAETQIQVVEVVPAGEPERLREALRGIKADADRDVAMGDSPLLAAKYANAARAALSECRRAGA